jgi:hypothetical protein
MMFESALCFKKQAVCIVDCRGAVVRTYLHFWWTRFDSQSAFVLSEIFLVWLGPSKFLEKQDMAATYILHSQFMTIIRFFIQHYVHSLHDEERLNKLLANKLQNSTPSHFNYSCCLMIGTEHVSLLVKVSSCMPYVYVCTYGCRVIR